MNTDKAFANFIIYWIIKNGDIGKGRVERISFLQIEFTHSVL